jgi:cytochrome c biogenesis protein
MQKIYPDSVIKKLANLKLAITLLLIISVIVALGTFIEQDKSLTFYQQNYPAVNNLFFTWKTIRFFQLDHVYTSFWFICLITVFSLSLFSCTLSVQLPTLRKFRRWKFYNDISKINGINKDTALITTNTLLYQLHYSEYHIFRQAKKNYAYSGLLGRVGPIVVHASIIFLLIGSTIGSLTGYVAQEIVPRGEIFHVQNILTFGNLTNISQDFIWRINDFWISYTEDFKTNQFYSDLSLLDNTGIEIKRKTIFVNEPFIYDGTVLYQTDWDIVGLKICQNDNNPIQIPLKKILKRGQKLWLGSFSLKNGNENQKITFLVNDLRGKVSIYDGGGIFIKDIQVGKSFDLISGEKLICSDILTSTGLQIKSDPGLNTVYLAFLLLIVSVYASFISYSQVWGSEKGNRIFIAGNSNRAVLFFQVEFQRITNKLTL